MVQIQLESQYFCSTKLDNNLVEPSLDIVLPVLVEVLVRHDIVPLCRHLLCKENICSDISVRSQIAGTIKYRSST